MSAPNDPLERLARRLAEGCEPDADIAAMVEREAAVLGPEYRRALRERVAEIVRGRAQRDPRCPVCVGHGVELDNVRTVLEIAADALGYLEQDTSERARKDAPTDDMAESLYADAARMDYAALTIRAWLDGDSPPTVPPPDTIPPIPYADEETPHVDS